MGGEGEGGRLGRRLAYRQLILQQPGNVAKCSLHRCVERLDLLGSCPSLSLWLVTVTSGLERKACACCGVFAAHMSISAFSNSADCSTAFWMQMMWCRWFLRWCPPPA